MSYDGDLKNYHDLMADDLEQAILDFMEAVRESPFEGDEPLVNCQDFLVELRNLTHLGVWVGGLDETQRAVQMQYATRIAKAMINLFTQFGNVMDLLTRHMQELREAEKKQDGEG